VKVTDSVTFNRAIEREDCGCITLMSFDDVKRTIPASVVFSKKCAKHAADEEMMLTVAEALEVKRQSEALAVAALPEAVERRVIPIDNPVAQAKRLERIGGAPPPTGTTQRPMTKPTTKAGGANHGIRLVNPLAESPAARAHLAKAAHVNAAPVMDIDEVPEDPRVTNLLESVMPLVQDDEVI
jgi:hypothetical protein